MNFDESVNKLLHEAYFSSPNEKATGIKRQVNLEGDSEFRETKNRKIQALIHAADEVISYYEAAKEEGEPLNKKELAELSIQKLASLEERMVGDEYNLDDMKEIEIVEAKTTDAYNRNSFIYNFMSSMRQKMNDPLGVRAKKRETISQR